jgi:hypothetical protein
MSVSGFSHVQPGLLQKLIQQMTTVINSGTMWHHGQSHEFRHIFLGLICKFTTPTGPAPPFFFHLLMQ